MHVLLDQTWAPVNVPSSASVVVVVSGGVHKLNCSEMLERWGLLKNLLTDQQKQQEALKTPLRIHPVSSSFIYL